MGTGIISSLKQIAPLSLYALIIVCCILAMVGRPRWALLMTTGLLPLRNVVEKLAYYPLGKDAIDILIFCMILGWVLSSLGQKRQLIAKSSLNVIVVLMVIYTYIAFLNGYQYLNYFTPFDIFDPRLQALKNFFLLPMLYFITLNIIKDTIWIRRVILAMCCAMILMDYYMVSQLSWFGSIESRRKIHGTFVFLGPNEVASFYNQYTIILMAIYFCMKKSLSKNVLLAIILANIYSVLFLVSRAAFLAMAVGLFLLFSIKKRYLLIPLILAAILWQTVLPEKMLARIEETMDPYGQLESSALNRLVVWEESIELWKQNHIIGLGFGVFSRLGLILGDTHNIYLKILVEQGVMGLVLFLTLIMCFFAQGIKLYRKGTDELAKGLGLGFAICMPVLLINNFFGDRWVYLELSGYLWIFAGLVARYNILSQEELKDSSLRKSSGDRPQPKLRPKT